MSYYFASLLNLICLMSHFFMLWAYRDGEEGMSKRARVQGLSSQHHKGLHLLHHEVIKFYPQCVETPHFSHRWPGRKSIAFLITDCASLLLDPWHLCPKLAQRSPWGFIDAWCRRVQACPILMHWHVSQPFGAWALPLLWRSGMTSYYIQHQDVSKQRIPCCCWPCSL